MLRRWCLAGLTAAGIVLLPGFAPAQDRKETDRLNPETMLKRLDANRDGVIGADELPDKMPERLKQLILRADKNGDKKVTLEELKGAMTDREGAPRKEGDRPPRPDRPREGDRDAPRADRPRDVARDTPRPDRPREGERRAVADAKVLFERLDRDKNGSLSLEEFTAGMRYLRSALTTPLPSPDAIRIRTKTEGREGAAKDRERPREKEVAKDRDRPRDKEVAKDRDRPRDKEVAKDRERPREKEAAKDRDRPREKEVAKDRDRPREKEAGKDRDRPREKEGAKDREQSDEKK